MTNTKSATPSDNIDKVEEILIGLARDVWKTGFNDKALSIGDNFGTTIELPKQALTTLINNEKIAELEMLPKVTYTKDGVASDISILLQHQHIKDRLAKLKKGSE